MANNTEDVELFELCKQVYEVTGWKGGDNFITTIGGKWISDSKKGWYDETIEADGFYPLYTSDYLLEKLPRYFEYWDEGNEAGYLTLRKMSVNYEAGYWNENEDHSKKFTGGYTDTSLKALLKLTLALKEAGEL